MNSSLVCTGILVKSNISKHCLIRFINDISSNALRRYLGAAEVYDGNANKTKSDLKEIVYGCMNSKLKNKIVEDISFNKAITVLREHKISIKSLPGYGNMGLRKKDIKPHVENKMMLNHQLIYRSSSYLLYAFNLFTLTASISISLLACITLSLIIISIILFFDILLGLIGNLE